ncbi:P-type DNA transfer ATPase VirB11 [Asticcacaulis sp. W401b]|uniref:P-type DNA transfer ATPase VirB11 n=1 Tax=Asticcacaulis sp. W401b TaxID=3388666 RepID=UPI003970CD46
MVRELLRPFTPYLNRPGLTELAINRPGEVFAEVGGTWECEAIPELSYERLSSLATSIANYTDQDIGPRQPILSAILPDGQRIQIVVPPACEPGTVSLSIRIPASQIRRLDDYDREGAFAHFTWINGPTPHEASQSTSDRALCANLASGNLAGFLERAVKARKNIAIVGETGSGKTTLMKTLCQSIPATERLITIEDVRELELPNHPNRVHLLYAKGGHGVAEITPSDLIASNMRMKPDRVLLAELRGSEAFDYLKLLTTGHAGSITSFHAESCALAAERYVFMCREHADAAVYATSDLKRLVNLTLDVIVHMTARGSGDSDRPARYVREVWFDPDKGGRSPAAGVPS